jgi:oligopeptide transport system substrate-binding protein
VVAIIKRLKWNDIMQIHHFVPRRRFVGMGLTMAALFVTIFAGCANNNAGAQLDPNQVFVMPNVGAERVLPQWATTPQKSPLHTGLNLDPAFVTDLYSTIVQNMIQMQLVTFDQNLQVVADGAQSWDVSPDGKTWTFHIRPGLEWSDGTALTSYDFAAGIRHSIDPNLCTSNSPNNNPNPTMTGSDGKRFAVCGSAPLGFYLGFVQGAADYTSGAAKTLTGVQTPDAQTLVFTLTAPISFFLDDLATVASVPLEQSVFKQYGYQYTEHFNEGVGQSGPFRIAYWTNPSSPDTKDPQDATQLTLTPNKHWWSTASTLKKIVIPLIPDVDQQYQSYQSGVPQASDYVQVPSHDFTFAESYPDFHISSQLSISYFGMNLFDPPFDNLQVRQAFALSLNKQLLVDSVLQGSNTPTNHIIPVGIPGANGNLLTPPNASQGSVSQTGNQTLAQQLIQQVAAGCLADISHDWCPYIVGSGRIATPVSQFGKGGASCPNYQVGTTTLANGAVQTAQQQIVVYGAHENSDRVAMIKAATAEWAQTLCLNVVSNEDINQPILFQNLIHDIYGQAGEGTQTKESIWTIGYGADYPDPSDFTSNQFLPLIPANPFAGNDAGNFGVPNPNANDTASQAAIVKEMQAADVMSASTAQQRQERYAAYGKIEQDLVNEVAWLPYDQQQTLYRLQPYVKGFALPEIGFLSDQEWSSVFIASH